jgi:hypothetical protein
MKRDLLFSSTVLILMSVMGILNAKPILVLKGDPLNDALDKIGLAYGENKRSIELGNQTIRLVYSANFSSDNIDVIPLAFKKATEMLEDFPTVTMRLDFSYFENYEDTVKSISRLRGFNISIYDQRLVLGSVPLIVEN